MTVRTGATKMGGEHRPSSRSQGEEEKRKTFLLPLTGGCQVKDDKTLLNKTIKKKQKMKAKVRDEV